MLLLRCRVAAFRGFYAAIFQRGYLYATIVRSCRFVSLTSYFNIKDASRRSWFETRRYEGGAGVAVCPQLQVIRPADVLALFYLKFEKLPISGHQVACAAYRIGATN